MLVDVNIWTAPSSLKHGSRKAKQIFDADLALVQPKKYKTGIYLCEDCNFQLIIDAQIVEDEDTFYHGQYSSFDNDGVSPYGVVDTPEQFLEKFEKPLAASTHKYVVALTIMRKADQPPEHGWRWNKWGAYYGTKSPKHEYLYDEDDTIQEVYCYHVYEVK